MLNEYETKFAIGEIVKFYIGDEPYIGEIEEILRDTYQEDCFKYDITSGGHNFVRFEYEIEPYEIEIDEKYMCDDCLLSHILDDVEEGELTANEAREILGLEMIELEEALVRNISTGSMILTEDGKTLFNLDTGSFRISAEDGSWTWIENEAETNEYAEHKTAGNSYFSIFPDDEHEDAVHIEIDPTWLWTNDDIDELIEHLKLAKVGNSNNDFRVEEVVDYYLNEAEKIPVLKFEGNQIEFNNSKILEEIENLEINFENSINVSISEYTDFVSNSVRDFIEHLKLAKRKPKLLPGLDFDPYEQEKEVFIVKTPYSCSEEVVSNLKDYIKKSFNNANRNVEILILPSDINISPA